MTEDKNKGMTVDYNHLNLPKKVTKTGGQCIQYSYDAGGTKLKKIVQDGSSTTVTDYVGGIQYQRRA